MALMAEGIKRAADEGKVTGESIKQALEEMDAFDTGGVSAPIDFSAESHAGMKGSKLYQVKDGTVDGADGSADRLVSAPDGGAASSGPAASAAGRRARRFAAARAQQRRGRSTTR